MAQRPSLSTKTGNATIDKMGHTTNGRNGSDPSKKGSVTPVRDLTIKGS